MTSAAVIPFNSASRTNGRTDDGLAPPHDLDAEAACLSAVMIDATALGKLSFLEPEHFYSEAHARIFEAARWLEANFTPIDILTVATRLKDTSRIAQVGGFVYLTEVLSAAPAVANVVAYGKPVRDKWRIRQLAEVCRRATVGAYHDYGDAQAFIEETERAVFELAQISDASSAVEAGTVLKDVVADMMAASARGDGLAGLSTGFAKVDRLTGGLKPGDLDVVAARTGMGKTAYALNVGMNVASNGDGVGVFSMEMPRKQCALRMVCARGKIDVMRAQRGELSQSEWNRFQTAGMEIAGFPAPMFIDDTPSMSVLDIISKARRLRVQLERQKKRLGLIIVDHLGLLRPLQRRANREQDVAEASRGLKLLAMDMKIPVMALVQVSREAEKEKDKRPQLRHLRESGAIEQDADRISFIYREDYYAKRDTGGHKYRDNLAEIIIAKQRNGPDGMAKLGFDREYTNFFNLSAVDE